jgi:hypothetical protein
MERLIEPHLKTLLLNARLAENCLEGVDDVVACKRLTGNTNHMAFVFCHLVAWAAVTALVAERLAEVAAAELLEPSGQTFPNEDSTRLGALAFLLQHEACHIGQLGLLRKALGFRPMHY